MFRRQTALGRYERNTYCSHGVANRGNESTLLHKTPSALLAVANPDTTSCLLDASLPAA
ncbi:hypothetical protein PAXRUDRAFT_830833 [Paxillus rubicundulus Ve08.2h10]|uniref:Uncharacterized protein n=1 Tax=Paxillus rubicundulus Ve08.2h10 TaxID=930991 RepID=A0A0D0CX14_9AGAM|nr:hypothetical protein PAXRUDRAFT_833726 [Paxillus rubicundulus Ve08.2h10]KIK91462.1 hypothetical protein PAXRUDRAFT_830833 [Paxillus rubicundulus Ve08.2h10]